MKKASNKKKAESVKKEVVVKSHENSKEILKMVSEKVDIYKASTVDEFKERLKFMTQDNMKSLCVKLGGVGKMDSASMKKFLLEKFEKDLSISKEIEGQDNVGRAYYSESVSARVKQIISRKI